MDDLFDILPRILDFAASNFWIVLVVIGLIASGRRSRRNQNTRMPLPNPSTPSSTDSKQMAQALYPPPVQGPVVITNNSTSVTTVTPPAVIEERPDDLMKDLVKRVG